MDQEERPTNNEQLLEWCNGLVEDGRERRLPWEGVWWENIATFAGDFWAEWDIHKKRLFESNPKPDHRVRIPVNLAQPVVRTEKAKILKNRPIADVLAKSDEKKDITAAEVGDKLLNHHAEREFHLPKVRRRAVDWVLMCGLGGIFVDYDENAEKPIEVYQSPKGDALFNETVIKAYQQRAKKGGQGLNKMYVNRGDLRIKELSPFQTIWDFSQNYVEDAAWIIVTEVMDVLDIEKRWGEEVEADDNVLPGVIESRIISQFDRSHRLTFNPPSTQRMAEVHRLFIKPGHLYFPRGAHIVFTKDKILKKENYPYKHSELPVSMMGHISYPIGQVPMSVLQQVKPPVLELSRTASQLIENRNVMANPPWLIAKQHKIDREIVNKPGLQIEFNYVPNVPEPHPIQMPEMPGYVQNLVPTLREVILDISGQGETSQGRVPPGARSGVAIAYLQEEDDTRLGPTIQEFEEMIERVSTQILELIAQFYDVPRTIRVYKHHSEPEVFDFVGKMLEGNTNVIVQAGSALPRSKAAKQQFMFDLWDRKLEQDPRRMRQMLELTEGDPDEFEIDFDQAERENRKLMRGEQVEVLPWYNHAAHNYIHRRTMKGAEFEELPDPIKRVFYEHDARHASEEEAQQRKQMEMQMMAAGQGANGGGPAPPPEGAPLEPGANGQNAPELAPQFQGGITPRSLLSDQPQ